MEFTQLESFIFDRMTQTGLPGLSVAVVKGDECIWARGFGFRDLKAGLPATSHTLYCFGSVTKPFTALSILQLVGQGKLSLDESVERYLPIRIRPAGQQIQVWHLLSHCSGIPALGSIEATIDEMVGSRSGSLPISSHSDVLAFMNGVDDWVVGPPGERWMYLNEGYALLAAIVETVSQTGYWEYLQKHVLNPLGISRCFLCQSESGCDSDSAIPYLITADKQREASTYPYGRVAAEGGLVGSVEALSRFLIMMLNHGRYQGRTLLSETLVDSMFEPRVATPYQGPFGEEGYALGFSVYSDFCGKRLVKHEGSIRVSTAYVGLIPEVQIGIALLANGSAYPLPQIGMYALALLLDEDAQRLQFLEWETRLEGLAGIYESFRGTIQVEIKRIGDFLLLQGTGGSCMRPVLLVPEKLREHQRSFYTLEGGERLPAEFQVDGGGIDLLYERYRLRRVGGCGRYC